MGAVWEGEQRCGLEGSRQAGRPEKAPREFRWDAGLHLRAIEKRKMAPEKDAGGRGPWRELVSGKLGETQFMIRGD